MNVATSSRPGELAHSQEAMVDEWENVGTMHNTPEQHFAGQSWLLAI